MRRIPRVMHMAKRPWKASFQTNVQFNMKMYHFSTSNQFKETEVPKFSVEEFLKEDKTLDLNLPENFDLDKMEMIPWYDYIKPSNWCLWGIEHIKDYFDLSWAPAIALSTLILRLVMAPGNIAAIQTQRKMQLLAPRVKPIQKKKQVAQKNRDAAKLREIRLEEKAIYSRYGVKQWKSFVPTGLMMVMFPSFMIGLRKLDDIVKYPDIVEGGYLWFKDLAASDPYYVMPTLVFLLTCVSSELTYHYNTKLSTTTPAGFKPVIRVFQPLMTGVLAFFLMPYWNVAIFMYWIPNAIFTLLTNVLYIPKIGKHFGIVSSLPKTKEELQRESADPLQRMLMEQRIGKDDVELNNKITKYTSKVGNFFTNTMHRFTPQKKLQEKQMVEKKEKAEKGVYVTRDMISKNQRGARSFKKKKGKK